MSSVAFSTLVSLQSELILANYRFSRDLSIILSHHAASLIQQDKTIELQSFFEKLYLTTSSIHYVRLFNMHGHLLFSFPMRSGLRKKLAICESINSLDNDNLALFFGTPTIKSLIDARYNITESIFPLVRDSKVSGFLQIGLSYGSSGFHSVKAAQDFSLVIFVAIWLMFLLGTTFNFLIIADPIKKLQLGLQNIAIGDFNQRIDSPPKGKIGELIIGFNEMSQRLLCYERENVAQLISEKSRLEALVSTIADGAILLDTDLRLLFVNQIAVKVFRWSSKDLIGQVVFQYLPVHVNEALLPILNTMLHSNYFDNKVLQAQEVKIDLYHESLKTFRFLLSTVLSHKTRVLSGVVITIQDITRETQLNDAKNQFIGNVSHELRTPLCNIRSFLETLIDYDYKLTSQQKSRFLAIAHTETQRLNSLVNDVLDLSRLESEHHYALNPVMLMHTIFYIAKTSQIIALNKKVHLVIEVHGQIEKALAHKISLCQVLSNLISNSLKFTHQKGKIIIRVYPLKVMSENTAFYTQQSRLVRLEVIDEGIGIDRAYHKQVFDRFVRIENNIHTLEGTGLGLSIVKSIVERHDSIIAFYSEAGIGTSFWFDLLIAA